jgi:hypothetical protein
MSSAQPCRRGRVSGRPHLFRVRQISNSACGGTAAYRSDTAMSAFSERQSPALWLTWAQTGHPRGWPAESSLGQIFAFAVVNCAPKTSHPKSAEN